MNLTSYTLCEAEVNHHAVRNSQLNSVREISSCARSTSWRKWLGFLSCLNLAPNLYWISNTIPYLQIFSYRIKVGTLSEKGASILKCTMEGYLCYVAHILSLWGETTPAWTTWVISTVGSTVNSRPMSEPTLPWTACNP